MFLRKAINPSFYLYDKRLCFILISRTENSLSLCPIRPSLSFNLTSVVFSNLLCTISWSVFLLLSTARNHQRCTCNSSNNPHLLHNF